MPSTHLLVCIRCRPVGRAPSAPHAGAALLRAVEGAVGGGPNLHVSGIACVSACKRACVAALLAPGKVGYLFGDLPADAAAASDLLAVARAYTAQDDGFLPRAARPERLRAGILARLPPLHWLSAEPGAIMAWPG